MSALPKRHVLLCECVGDDVDPECEALDAEVRDLKARLKAAREMTSTRRRDNDWIELTAVLDNRFKNWRKARGEGR